jgi:hypothetical protein
MLDEARREIGSISVFSPLVGFGVSGRQNTLYKPQPTRYAMLAIQSLSCSLTCSAAREPFCAFRINYCSFGFLGTKFPVFFVARIGFRRRLLSGLVPENSNQNGGYKNAKHSKKLGQSRIERAFNSSNIPGLQFGLSGYTMDGDEHARCVCIFNFDAAKR